MHTASQTFLVASGIVMAAACGSDGNNPNNNAGSAAGAGQGGVAGSSSLVNVSGNQGGFSGTAQNQAGTGGGGSPSATCTEPASDYPWLTDYPKTRPTSGSAELGALPGIYQTQSFEASSKCSTVPYESTGLKAPYYKIIAYSANLVIDACTDSTCASKDTSFISGAPAVERKEPSGFLGMSGYGSLQNGNECTANFHGDYLEQTGTDELTLFAWRRGGQWTPPTPSDCGTAFANQTVEADVWSSMSCACVSVVWKGKRVP